jgi:hypothetical protein
MLWPRILYWAAFVLTILGLFYGMTGINSTPGPVAQSNTQAGGALFALLGLLVMMGAKAWMDFVVRSRSKLPCPNCGSRNTFAAMHCPSCGVALRAVHSPTASTNDAPPAAPGLLGLVCQSCGMGNPRTARFCSSCASSLQAVPRLA